MGPIQLIWKVGLICNLIKATFVWNVNNKLFQKLYVLLNYLGRICVIWCVYWGQYFLGKTKIVEKEARYVDLNSVLI